MLASVPLYSPMLACTGYLISRMPPCPGARLSAMHVLGQKEGGHG
jgi:hypothetical protein